MAKEGRLQRRSAAAAQIEQGCGPRLPRMRRRLLSRALGEATAVAARFIGVANAVYTRTTPRSSAPVEAVASPSCLSSHGVAVRHCVSPCPALLADAPPCPSASLLPWEGRTSPDEAAQSGVRSNSPRAPPMTVLCRLPPPLACGAVRLRGQSKIATVAAGRPLTGSPSCPHPPSIFCPRCHRVARLAGSPLCAATLTPERLSDVTGGHDGLTPRPRPAAQCLHAASLRIGNPRDAPFHCHRSNSSSPPFSSALARRSATVATGRRPERSCRWTRVSSAMPPPVPAAARCLAAATTAWMTLARTTLAPIPIAPVACCPTMAGWRPPPRRLFPPRPPRGVPLQRRPRQCLRHHRRCG